MVLGFPIRTAITEPNGTYWATRILVEFGKRIFEHLILCPEELAAGREKRLSCLLGERTPFGFAQNPSLPKPRELEPLVSPRTKQERVLNCFGVIQLSGVGVSSMEDRGNFGIVDDDSVHFVEARDDAVVRGSGQGCGVLELCSSAGSTPGDGVEASSDWPGRRNSRRLTALTPS